MSPPLDFNFNPDSLLTCTTVRTRTGCTAEPDLSLSLDFNFNPDSLLAYRAAAAAVLRSSPNPTDTANATTLVLMIDFYISTEIAVNKFDDAFFSSLKIPDFPPCGTLCTNDEDDPTPDDSSLSDGSFVSADFLSDVLSPAVPPAIVYSAIDDGFPPSDDRVLEDCQVLDGVSTLGSDDRPNDLPGDAEGFCLGERERVVTGPPAVGQQANCCVDAGFILAPPEWYTLLPFRSYYNQILDLIHKQPPKFSVPCNYYQPISPPTATMGVKKLTSLQAAAALGAASKKPVGKPIATYGASRKRSQSTTLVDNMSDAAFAQALAENAKLIAADGAVVSSKKVLFSDEGTITTAASSETGLTSYSGTKEVPVDPAVEKQALMAEKKARRASIVKDRKSKLVRAQFMAEYDQGKRVSAELMAEVEDLYGGLRAVNAAPQALMDDEEFDALSPDAVEALVTRMYADEIAAARIGVMSRLRGTTVRTKATRSDTEVDDYQSDETLEDAATIKTDPDWKELEPSRGRSRDAKPSAVPLVVRPRSRSKQARKEPEPRIYSKLEKDREELRRHHPEAVSAIYGDISPPLPPTKSAKRATVPSFIPVLRAGTSASLRPRRPSMVEVIDVDSDEDLDTGCRETASRRERLTVKLQALARRRAAEHQAKREAEPIDLVDTDDEDISPAAFADLVDLMDCHTSTPVSPLGETGRVSPPADLADLLSAARITKDLIDDGVSSRRSAAATRSSTIFRCRLDYVGAKRVSTGLDQLGEFVRAALGVDAHFQILPWDEGSSPAPIFDSSTLRYAAGNFRAYVQTRQVIFSQLMGNVRIRVSLDPLDFIRIISQWGASNGYKISALSCQSQMQARIGFLLNSSSFVNKADTAAAIRRHPLWAILGGFTFGLSNSKFKAENAHVWCLMVEVDKKEAVKGVKFFTALYNDESVKPPLGAQFYFYVTQYNDGNRSTRSELVQHQKQFLLTESKVCLGGFAGIDTALRLKKGTGTATLRELLCAMRNPSRPSEGLLYGVDVRVSNGTNEFDSVHIYLRFNRECRETVYGRLPTLEEDIQSVVKEEDYSLVVASLATGLYHFGGYPLMDAVQAPDDMSVSTDGVNAGRTNAVLALIRRSHREPLIVGTDYVAMRSAWLTPPPVASGAPGGGSLPRYPSEVYPSHVSTPSAVVLRRVAPIPTVTPAQGGYQLPTPSTASTFSTEAVVWQARATTRMEQMEESAITYMAKVDGIATDISAMKESNGDMMKFIKETFTVIRQNPEFGAALRSDPGVPKYDD